MGDAVDDPDPKVVAAARSGDLGAFETLVRRYQPDVWRFSYRILHDRAAADDVTQDAFVRAFRFIGRYRGTSSFSTWLLQITRNCAVDEIRRSGRRAALMQRAGDLRAPSLDPTVGIEVREAVVALSLELREAVVLVDVLGLPYAQAADVLAVPEGTVKSRVHRARSALSDSLEPRPEEDAGEG